MWGIVYNMWVHKPLFCLSKSITNKIMKLKDKNVCIYGSPTPMFVVVYISGQNIQPKKKLYLFFHKVIIYFIIKLGVSIHS